MRGYEYSVCIDMMALLYSKLSINADMVQMDLIDQYNDSLKRTMNERGQEYDTVRTSYYDDPQTVFDCLNDTKGNCYSVLNSKYINGENLEEIWEKHLMFQNADLIATSIDPELLAILGIFDSTKILNFLSKVGFKFPEQSQIFVNQKQNDSESAKSLIFKNKNIDKFSL